MTGPESLRRALVVDTETSGVEESAEVVEVACALYDLRAPGLVGSMSMVLPCRSVGPTHVHGITSSLATSAPWTKADVWTAVERMASHADVALAHHADFDERYVPKSAVEGLPWVCTMQDVAWPRRSAGRESLISLALRHGVGVSSAHRAGADVDLIVRLLDRAAEMGANLVEIVAPGLRPKGLFMALVPYERRGEAKEEGFSWRPDKRRWERRMAIEDAERLPFLVRRLDEEDHS